MIVAIHDTDMLTENRQGSYLRRSAQILRAQVTPPLPVSKNLVDLDIRLVLDSSGPRFARAGSIGEREGARQAGRFWYIRVLLESGCFRKCFCTMVR